MLASVAAAAQTAPEMVFPPIGSLEDVLARFAVSPAAPMREVLSRIDANGEGVILVLDAERRLAGIVTDGDIRRALLTTFDFDEPAGDFLAHKVRRVSAKPLTAPAGTPERDLLTLMEVRLVRHLPLVDDAGRVVGLALLSQLAKEAELPLHAVVMAGGQGMRLRPLTEKTPKPLLPVGDRPLIDHIMEQLHAAGVRRVSITTHYLADQVEKHVGDGSAFGVQVRYARERKPLGTAGALSLLQETDEPLLVMNGDVLTGVDFRAMHAFHRENGADITVGVRRYEMPVPYGVFEVDGVNVTKLEEKPTKSLFINAGIYLLEPSVLSFLSNGERLDMTDLIQLVLAGRGAVASFPIHEYWIDIGRHQDYERAQNDLASGRMGR